MSNNFSNHQLAEESLHEYYLQHTNFNELVQLINYTLCPRTVPQSLFFSTSIITLRKMRLSSHCWHSTKNGAWEFSQLLVILPNLILSLVMTMLFHFFTQDECQPSLGSAASRCVQITWCNHKLHDSVELHSATINYMILWDSMVQVHDSVRVANANYMQQTQITRWGTYC